MDCQYGSEVQEGFLAVVLYIAMDGKHVLKSIFDQTVSGIVAGTGPLKFPLHQPSSSGTETSLTSPPVSMSASNYHLGAFRSLSLTTSTPGQSTVMAISCAEHCKMDPLPCMSCVVPFASHALVLDSPFGHTPQQIPASPTWRRFLTTPILPHGCSVTLLCTSSNTTSGSVWFPPYPPLLG